jgi:hypothetical protein
MAQQEVFEHEGLARANPSEDCREQQPNELQHVLSIADLCRARFCRPTTLQLWREQPGAAYTPDDEEFVQCLADRVAVATVSDKRAGPVENTGGKADNTGARPGTDWAPASTSSQAPDRRVKGRPAGAAWSHARATVHSPVLAARLKYGALCRKDRGLGSAANS